MKIVMDALSAGPTGVRFRGAEYDVPAVEGRALIAGGYAHAATKETAARSAPAENAAQQKPSRKSRGSGKSKPSGKSSR